MMGEVVTEGSRFNRHADRLVERHGDRVWRLGLDGGFGCPNRAGGQGAASGRGGGGCAYCAPSGARAPYLVTSPDEGAYAGPPGSPEALAAIASEVRRGIDFTRRRYGARLFFPYFQAFSSTNAEPGALRASYEAALSAVESEAPGALRGLVVSTRPDCVDRFVAELLEEIASRGLEVWVELGLQSGVDATLERLGRGHDVDCFVSACRILARPGLRVGAHLILGLPGETRREMLEGARLVAGLGLAGVKLHDLHIVRGSRLEGEYRAGELELLSLAGYLSVLAEAVELLPPTTELLRLCTDSSDAQRLAPRRAFDKRSVYEGLENLLAQRGTRQGDAWSKQVTCRVSGIYQGKSGC
jgi:radical SAM protein (TIGR01212 family)